MADELKVVYSPTIKDQEIPEQHYHNGIDQPKITQGDIDAGFVLRTGDTMTGELILDGNTGEDAEWDAVMLKITPSVHIDGLSNYTPVLIIPSVPTGFVVSSIFGIAFQAPTGDVSAANDYTAIYADFRTDTVADNYIGLNILVDATDYAAKLTGKVNLAQKAGSTGSGDIWNDSTQKGFQVFIAGIEQTLQGVIFTQTADASVGDTASETTLVGTGVGTVTLPANFFAVGKTIRIKAMGYLDSSATPPTHDYHIELGSTTVVSTGAQTPTANMSDEFWEIEAYLTCRTTGASGTIQGWGTLRLGDDSTSSAFVWDMLSTTTTTVATNASQVIGVTLTKSANTTGNTVISQILTVEVLN